MDKKIENLIGKEELGRIIANMSLMDDELMARVFDNNVPATELLIKTILGRNVKIIDTKGQYDMKNPEVKGRNVRLDIFAQEENGTAFNCEVQRDNGGAIPKRARFHSAMLDSRLLKEKEEFKDMKDSYVIFITEKDYYHKGRPLYHVERNVDFEESFDDGNHIIYVNGSYDGDDDLGHLMQDMRNRTLDGFNYREIEEGVRHFKSVEEGKNNMSSEWKESIEKYGKIYGKMYGEEIAEELAEEIAEKKAEEIAEKKAEESRLQSLRELMKNLKLSAEQAMEAIGIPSSEHQKYLQKL